MTVAWKCFEDTKLAEFQDHVEREGLQYTVSGTTVTVHNPPSSVYDFAQQLGVQQQ